MLGWGRIYRLGSPKSKVKPRLKIAPWGRVHFLLHFEISALSATAKFIKMLKDAAPPQSHALLTPNAWAHFTRFLSTDNGLQVDPCAATSASLRVGYARVKVVCRRRPRRARFNAAARLRIRNY